MSRALIKEDLEKISCLMNDELSEGQIKSVERMGGLTNHTYKVTLASEKVYVVRLPGKGTEELINRADEMISTKLACEIGIDAPMLSFKKDGTKITEYIENAETMSSETMKEKDIICKAAAVLKKLHDSGVNTGVAFEVFQMAENYEKIIKNNQIDMYDDYLEIKEIVFQMKKRIDSYGKADLVPCHNDPLCENWILGKEEKLYLIDWEYAGMNDGMWDLADVSIEASYETMHDELLLKEYLGKEPTERERERFVANKVYLDFLWTLWGKTRVPYDGQQMEDYAFERYERLKKTLKYFE